MAPLTSLDSAPWRIGFRFTTCTRPFCICWEWIERLTYRYAGRDFRLTDVYGEVVKDVVS